MVKLYIMIDFNNEDTVRTIAIILLFIPISYFYGMKLALFYLLGGVTAGVIGYWLILFFNKFF